MIYKHYLIEQNITNVNENLILFHGENLGFINEVKEKIKSEYKEAEIIRFVQEDLVKNPNILFEEINNISLFEKNKIFCVDQVNDKIIELIKEIQEIETSNKIFLFAEVLEKKSKIRNLFEKSKICASIACYPDNEISIKKIISNKLKGYDGIDQNVVNLILKNSNLDRIKLNNELSKIITYFDDKRINSEELMGLLDLNVNNDFNKLKDEAITGNKVNTNELLSETVMEAEKNIYYLSIINMRLNKLYQINHINNDISIEDRVEKIKPPIFWKDKPKIINQAKKWNSNKIKNMLRKTFDIEKKIKSNNIINKELLIKKLILDICDAANA